MARPTATRERAALVGLIGSRRRRLDAGSPPGRPPRVGGIGSRERVLAAERSLDELAGLADAAGAAVVLRVLQERPKPDPSTFLGAGKIKTLAVSASELNA